MGERLRRRFGLLYGILVAIIVAIGGWWVVFLAREGGAYERLQLQALAAQRAQAEYLIRTVPEIAAEPGDSLQETFPDLLYLQDGGGPRVEIDPAAVRKIRREAGRRQRMFLAEGSVFLLLLAAAATILRISWRSQRDFERARELFLAGAAHELKTPLASLRLSVETLQRPDLGPELTAPIHERLRKDTDRLERLIERLLRSGREETLEPPEVLDVAEVVGEVLRDSGDFLRSRGATVTVDLPAGHEIRGERAALVTAVQNLLHNAVRHDPEPARVGIALVRSGRRLRLSIGDSGPGIPRRQQEAVFRGFQSRDRAGGGLGLYLVRRSVERLGGRVKLESRPGEGSTFTIELPALERKRK